MYYPHRCGVSLFLTIFCILFTYIHPSSSLRIENCSTLLGNDLPSTIYDVKIDAEIEWNKAHGVASIEQMKFFIREYKLADVNDFTMYVTSMKAVRVQRFIEYTRKGFKDIIKPYCSLSFVYDYNTSLQIPYGLEDDIILHAENCIQKVLCNFDPEEHKIGDDIHVISTNRQENLRTTTQATMNSLMDFVLDAGQHRIINDTKLIIHIPKIEVSAYTIKFSSSGGVLDILKYMKRDGDLSFQNEGHCYTIATALRSTGGYAELYDVSLSSVLGNFVKGQIPVNVTDATVRVKITLDYNQSPCKISATDVAINVAPEQFDFSTLTIKALGFEVTNAEKVLNTLSLKPKTVTAINNKLGDLVKTIIEGLECENYRDLLFKLKQKV